MVTARARACAPARRGGGGRTVRCMWKRFRRRSFAPSRPVLHPDQAGLVIFTIVALGAGIFVVARYLV